MLPPVIQPILPKNSPMPGSVRILDARTLAPFRRETPETFRIAVGHRPQAGQAAASVRNVWTLHCQERQEILQVDRVEIRLPCQTESPCVQPGCPSFVLRIDQALLEWTSEQIAILRPVR